MATTLNTPHFNAYRRTIPAFDQTQIDAEGDFFYVKESEQPLLYQMDLGPDLPWDVGTGPDSRGNAQFSRLTIKNPWSTPVVVVVYIGKGGIVDNRFTLVPSRDFAIPVREATTEVIARPATFIAGGAIVAFPGTPILPHISRKAILVSNPDSALDLQFVDTLGNVISTIFFRTSAILNISGPIGVKNPNGSAVTCSVSEFWYTKPL
jgi:hypothetical protein